MVDRRFLVVNRSANVDVPSCVTYSEQVSVKRLSLRGEAELHFAARSDVAVSRLDLKDDCSRRNVFRDAHLILRAGELGFVVIRVEYVYRDLDASRLGAGTTVEGDKTKTVLRLSLAVQSVVQRQFHFRGSIELLRLVETEFVRRRNKLVALDAELGAVPVSRCRQDVGATDRCCLDDLKVK